MTAPRFAHLLRPELADLAAYVPHTGDHEIRLDGNEAPPLLSSNARAGVAHALAAGGLERYPDPRATELREAIAAHVGATPDEVLVGTGSDEVIALLLTTLSQPRAGADAATILTPSPTFVMYRLSAAARGIRVLEVPLDERWDLDVAQMRAAIEAGEPNIVFLATPNNPTGNRMSEDRIRAVIEAAEGALVVLDEAYVAFAPASLAHLRHVYPNVAMLGTISKIGFAALRIGWLVGPVELIREVDKVRQPYNLPTPSQRAATFVLRELRAEIDHVVAHVVGERERLGRELGRIGFGVSPSDANFLWVETNRPAKDVFEGLAASKILVRSFHARGGRLANRLRITIGTREENDRLLEAIARWA
ncbi:histidinol-phosphate transaminase [Polyangium sorediatum]|uniref:Histidinol-phosphate aminotransferase n=1 Tax=Polyangium sorediatum TaxID=889274 RepID=A0ABT6P0M2_9BACT|nr:histidinol-phosphate transaminase [Polyangium sorediatum]MDI1434149.1 histidinol-phosphate transaminase [Polyangium sorediatum]